MKSLVLKLFLALQLIAAASYAAPGLTLQGRLLNPDGSETQAANITFVVQIRSPGTENCLLYQEQHTLSTLNTGGVFAITVGKGTRAASSVDGGYSLERIFSNRGTLDFSSVSSACASGTSYTPGAKDDRKLVYSFNDNSGNGWQTVPVMSINYAPLAVESLTVGGFDSSNILRVENAGVPGAAPALTSAQATELMNLITAASTVYVKPGSAVFTAAPKYNAAPVAADDLVNKAYVDAQVAAGLPNVGTAGTYTKVTTDAQGRVTAGATLAESDIPSLTTAGKVDGGAINAGTIGGSAAINTTGNIVTGGTVSGNTLSGNQLRVYNGANYVQFTAPNLGGSNVNYILPAADGSANQVLKTDGAGNLSWISPSAGSVTDVTASAPLSSSGGATPNITIAQANTTTAGYLSSADWNTFNNKLGTSSTFSGDVSGTSSTMSVDKIKGKDVVPVVYGSGQFLRYDGTNWVNAALTAGDIPAVDSAKITDGTIVDADISASAAIARSKMAAGTASHVLINDGSGNMSSEAQLAVSRGGTGLSGFGNNSVIVSNATGTALSSLNCTSGQVIKFDASGFAGCGTDTGASGNEFVNGGNSFTVDATLGTNDNYALNFETNNTTRMTILNDGKVGFGVASPTTKIQIDSSNDPENTNPNPSGAISIKSTSNTSLVAGVRAGTPYEGWIQVRHSNLAGQTYPLALQPMGGNVGIGTSSPGNTLTVSGPMVSPATTGSSGNGVLRVQNLASTGASIDMGVDNPGTPYTWIQSRDRNDYSANYSLALNPNGGKVGIGTTSPDASALLDISSTTKGVLIPRMTTAQRDAITAPATGLQVYNTSDNKLNYYNGSAWTELGVAGSGLSSLNGLGGTSHTFATGTSGTDFGISSVGSTHTFNIPTASATNRGALSSADWTTFNNKLDTSSTFSGDVSGTSSTMSVDKIKGKDVVPVAYGSGQFLRYDGTNWVNAALTAGDIPAVDSAKITDGTIVDADISASAAIARSKMAAGTASQVLINDGSGNMSSEAQLAVSRGGTGLSGFGNNSVIVSNTTGTALNSLNCTSGQVIKFDASGYAGCGADTGASGNEFVNGGNSFTADATLGTNDNYNLNFETNNTTRMTILNDGKVGIGTVSPSLPLEVNGSFRAGQIIMNNGLPASTPGMAINHSEGYAGTINATTNSGGDTVGALHVGVAGNAANPNYYGIITLSKANSTWDGGTTALLNGHYLSGIGFAGQTNGSSSTGMQIGASIIPQVDGTVSSGVLPTAITFRTSLTDNTGLSEKMRITSAGNVGIGTNAPSTILDINGAFTQREMTAPALAPADQGRIYFDSTANKFKVSENGAAYVDLVGSSGITGSGTTGKLALFTATGAIGDSALTESASDITTTKNLIFPDQATISSPSGAKYMIGLWGQNKHVFDTDAGSATSLYFRGLAGGWSAGEITVNKNVGSNNDGTILLKTGNGGNQLFLDSTGNVGIGTNSPSTILDINGAFTQREMAAPAVAPADQGRIYFDSTANKFKVSEHGGAYVDLVGGGADNLGNHTATSNIQLGSNWLSGDGGNEGIRIDADGKVGIYTASPAMGLSIAGDPSAVAVGIDVTDTRPGGATARVISNFYGLGGPGMGTTGNHAFTLFTNNTGRMTLDTTGNVGIGTWNPSANLQIVGSNSAGNAGTALAVTGGNSTGVGAGGGIYLTGGNGSAGAGGLISLTGGIGSGGAGGQIALTAGGEAAGGAGSALLLNGGALGGPGGSTSLTGGNGGNGYSGGNVSISGGTGTGAGTGGSITLNGGTYGGGNGDGGDVTILGGAKTGTGVNGNVLLATTRGNVGIGTTAPSTILDINGAVSVREMAAPAVAPADQGRIYFDSTANKFKVSEHGGAYVDLVSSGSGISGLNSGYVPKATSATSIGDSAIYESGGLVGIGTASPASLVDIRQTAVNSPLDLFALRTAAGTSGGNFVNFKNSAGSSIFNIDVGGSFAGGSYTFSNVGKVSYDAGAYSAKLEGLAGRGVILMSNTADGATAVSHKIDTNVALSTAGAKLVSFRNNGTEKSFIDYNGGAFFNANVGIGTSSPSYGLHIAPTSGVTAGQTVFIQDATPTTGATKVIIREGATTGVHGFDFQDSAGTSIVRMSGAGLVSGLELTNLWARTSIFKFHTKLGGTAGDGLRISNTNNHMTGTSGTYNFMSVGEASSAGTFNPTSGSAVLNTLRVDPVVNQTGTATGITRGLYVVPTLTSASDWRSVETANNTGFAVYAGGTAPSYFGGNVGIGTNAPSTILDINGAVSVREMAAPAVAPADQGRIYFDSTANKFKVSEHGGAYVDLVGGAGSASLSALSAATATNTIDNLNNAQTWNWSTATTQTPMALTANALTTGSMLSVTSSNNSLNSTSGLINVANTGTSTNGLLARFQSNSTAGSGLTVLNNGKVGVGTSAPAKDFQINATTPYLRLEGTTNGVIDYSQGGTSYSSINLGWNGISMGVGGHAFGINSPGTGIDYVLAVPDGTTRSLVFRNIAGAWSAAEIKVTKTAGSNANGTMVLKTTGHSVDQVVLDSAGNVGVGTATPYFPLEIKGAPVGVSGSIMGLYDSTAAGAGVGGGIAFEGNRDGSTIATFAAIRGIKENATIGDNSGALTFLVRSSAGVVSERVRVDSSGNVGIGTNAPSTVLDINGAFTAREMAAPAVAPADQGRIYFDSTANKFKVSEHGGAYADLVKPNISVADVTVSGNTTLALPSSGNSLQNLTMTATATISIPAGGYIGQTMMVTLCQDGTGGNVPTFAGSGTTLRATYPAGWPTTTANKCDVCGWVYYSTNTWMLTGCNLNQ